MSDRFIMISGRWMSVGSLQEANAKLQITISLDLKSLSIKGDDGWRSTDPFESN